MLENLQARDSTATCLEETTELLCISNKLYHNVIEKAMRKDLERRIGFLKEIRIFSHKSGAYLQRLLLFFTPIKIDFGKVLYKVGE